MKGSLAMTIIGMLHHRLDPTTVLKSYAFAAVAKAEGATFFTSHLKVWTLPNVLFEQRSMRMDNGRKNDALS